MINTGSIQNTAVNGHCYFYHWPISIAVTHVYLFFDARTLDTMLNVTAAGQQDTSKHGTNSYPAMTMHMR